jgi:SAM-dependent methyltransferase
MCSPSCVDFVRTHVSSVDVIGKHVLEVGALDVNGSARPVIEALEPASYTGTDITWGRGVDELCDVTGLIERYGEDTFDLVVSTELVEHVKDWRAAFTNLKAVVRPGGTILVTTRSRGFKVHGYPRDYWRYEPEDMERVFADFEEVMIEPDGHRPGVFVRARKPMQSSVEAPLTHIALFSVVAGKRTRDVTAWADLAFRLRFRASRTAHGVKTRLHSNG